MLSMPGERNQLHACVFSIPEISLSLSIIPFFHHLVCQN
jgi:hypothetical protein